MIPDLLAAVPRGRAYVGVGPEQNFTYIAALQPQVAFIVDVRRQNLVLHLMYKGLMELSSDRATFVSRLLSRPVPAELAADAPVTELFARFAQSPPDTLLFWTTLDTLRKHLMETRGFPLAGQDKESLFYVFASFAEGGANLLYSFGQMGGQRFGRWMPTLAELRNLIIPVVGDFGGDKALRAVAYWLRAHDAILGAFSSSNVEQYLFMQGGAAPNFYASLGTFPHDRATRFVRGVSNRGWLETQNPRSRLAQRAVSPDAMLELVRAGKATTYWRSSWDSSADRRGRALRLSLPVSRYGAVDGVAHRARNEPTQPGEQSPAPTQIAPDPEHRTRMRECTRARCVFAPFEPDQRVDGGEFRVRRAQCATLFALERHEAQRASSVMPIDEPRAARAERAVIVEEERRQRPSFPVSAHRMESGNTPKVPSRRKEIVRRSTSGRRIRKA